MCRPRLEMHTYLNIQHAWLLCWAAAGLGWLERGNFSLEDAAFSPAVAPPPGSPPPPALLFPPLAMQVLLRLFTLTKLPFPLKMDSPHQSEPVPGTFPETRDPLLSELACENHLVLSFLGFHTTEAAPRMLHTQISGASARPLSPSLVQRLQDGGCVWLPQLPVWLCRGENEI